MSQNIDIVYLDGCPHCGGILDNIPGFSGKCPYCGQIVGHDAAQCPCETCQMYRDAQMGLELLDQLKREKAKRIADGISEKVSKPQVDVVITDSGKFIIQTGKICPHCGCDNRFFANFCKECGEPFK